VTERDPAKTENAVHGTVVGPAVQAGAIHGGVHFHSAPSTAEDVVPRQLPPPPALLVGRDTELAQLHLARLDGHLLIVLTGYGGVGKTFLARRWAHDIRESYPAGQLSIDLNGFSESDPLDPGEALSLFLVALGTDPAALPASLPALVGLFRSRTADKAMLIILDNAFSAAQVRALLPASATSLVIVTSRRQLTGLIPDGAAIVHVEPLSSRDSLTLISQVIGEQRVKAEFAQAEALACLCGGLPLMLSVAAARLLRRPHLRLTQMTAGLSRRDESPTFDETEQVFDLSYRALARWLGALYRRLAVNPGPEFGPGPVAALLKEFASSSAVGHDADTTLDLLLEANLLVEIGADRFRMHDMLLRYAKRRLATEESAQQRDRATIAVLEWYLAAAGNADMVVTPYRRRLPYAAVTVAPDVPSFANREAALNWLATERINMIAAGQLALKSGWPELAWHFSDVMWPLLLYRKHYRDRQTIDETGVEAARRWGNAFAEADMLKRLGRTLTRNGDYDEAERHLRHAAARFHDVGDGQGVADAQEMLAALYRDCGRTTEAVALFDDVLAAYRRLGAERNVGLALINLASLLPSAGRIQEAVSLLHEARSIFSRLASTDPYNGVRVEYALATVHLAAGELREAYDAAAGAAEGMRQLGAQHEEVRALELLAQLAQLRGDPGTAGQHEEAAARIRRSLAAGGAVLGDSPSRRAGTFARPILRQD
jgi:tetratricopeptide (TPR) repeat protein